VGTGVFVMCRNDQFVVDFEGKSNGGLVIASISRSEFCGVTPSQVESRSGYRKRTIGRMSHECKFTLVGAASDLLSQLQYLLRCKEACSIAASSNIAQWGGDHDPYSCCEAVQLFQLKNTH
jgi:hypothetical protein